MGHQLLMLDIELPGKSIMLNIKRLGYVDFTNLHRGGVKAKFVPMGPVAILMPPLKSLYVYNFNKSKKNIYIFFRINSLGI
jgi:hypothetical protein